MYRFVVDFDFPKNEMTLKEVNRTSQHISLSIYRKHTSLFSPPKKAQGAV